MKRCLDCGEVKSFDEFSPAPRGVGGRTSYCKPCMTERSKASYRKRQAAAGRSVKEFRETPAGQKWCAECKNFKSLDDFCANKRTKSGRATYCKDCHNARSWETRERQYGGGREYHLRNRMTECWPSSVACAQAVG